MDFLNDKKNQPIIIAVTVAIVLGVAFFYYQTMFKPQSSGSTAPAVDYSQQSEVPVGDSSAAPDASAPSPMSPAPATPQDPSAVSTIETTSLVADASAAEGSVVRPLEQGTDDPFKAPPAPPGPPPPPPPPEPIPYPTFRIVPKKLPEVVALNPSVQEMDQTPRRMAGLLYNGSISAILETGNDSVVVKPGDYVENRTMRVEKIEPGRIVLKSMSTPTRFVEVRMASSANIVGSSSAPAPSSAPSTPRLPGRGGGGNVPLP